MFGINDDRPQEQQRQDEKANDSQPVRQDDSRRDSPFAAAYSSLNAADGGQHSSPAPHQHQSNGTIPQEDLLQIKTQALASLAPLVNHLDQTAEERFKTTMMMIQASDNPDLIRDAYQAADKIEDEKVRAQALLDVINEINYFTQKEK